MNTRPHAPPNPDRRPDVQFSVAGLLAALAAIAAILGMCITLAELDDATSTHSGLASEIQMIDGVPEAVPVRVRVSTDTGHIISSSHLRSLYAALTLEIATLVACALYIAIRAGKNRRRLTRRRSRLA
jgi:hypothetical protein